MIRFSVEVFIAVVIVTAMLASSAAHRWCYVCSESVTDVAVLASCIKNIA